MRLKRFRIQNYKIIDDTDWVEVDENVTSLVGKNESGKTGVLRSLWKSRNSASVEFDKLNDYPRDRYSKERKGQQDIVFTEFALTPEEAAALSATVSHTGDAPKTVIQETRFDGEEAVKRKFVVPELASLRKKGDVISATLNAILHTTAKNHKNLESAIQKAADACLGALKENDKLWGKDNVAALSDFQAALSKAVPDEDVLATEKANVAELVASAKKGDPLAPAIEWIEKHMPVFIYFDDYGQLETRIWLTAYLKKLDKPDAKTRTQRALFQLSNIDPQEILTLGRARDPNESDPDVQRRKDKRLALLQSASFSLTGDWVDWWTEKRHKLHFNADGEDLVLQVSDEEKEFPIPFQERSQGFQWFFSFYLVFLVESDSEHRDAILLMDEPGLHLHPTLQQQLIGFFDRIAKKNQLLYSTHLPFLVDGDHLERVRTVYLHPETAKTVVSPDVRAGADHDTLFPIQAALGYSIAQTLFLGKKCVIVEGITDYWLMKTLDAGLAVLAPTKVLDQEIVLVPAGGTSRMMPLASLMFGASGVSGKNMLVLLDSDKEGRNAQTRLEADLFPDDSRVVLLGTVLNAQKASIEDLVERTTYAKALTAAGFPVTFDSTEQAAACNVDAATSAFQRLNLGPFDHVAKTKAALYLVDQWGANPKSIEDATLQKVAMLFNSLNDRFASTST